MGIDPNWGAQAVTGLDISAMSASESMASSSREAARAQTAQLDERTNVAGILGDMVTLGRSESFRGPDANPREAQVVAPSDHATGQLHGAYSGGSASPLEYLAENRVAADMNAAQSTSLITTSFRDQQYLGSIVDYTA